MVSGELDVGTAQLSLNLNSSVSSDSKQHKQYTIPRGTTLAYICYKIKLDKNLLRLQLAEDITDAPPPQHESRIFSEKAVQSALHHLLSSDVSNDVILMLRKILKNDPSCASKLNDVIEDFFDHLEGEDVSCKVTVQHLEKLFSDQVYKDCCALLEKVGFGIYKERNEVIFSGKEELLKSLCALLECLSKMSKYQILALVDCDITHRQAIITIMKIAMKLTDGLDEKHVEPDPVATKFLTAIGVKTEISNGFSVQYLPKNQSVMNLRNITVAVYGMC
ncbi:uncharacterized protein LOC124453544 [Xenia sp. Carnegie-2017]|uniref:uncharacterized protein LOC124453544 n=1 Tax=Xenia sp. Carnegie-2017 TaxID=2897299 RepID=UPI001F0437ED|nr:uncharacterized protein LOC124453544 [Xenia sp. Carnegie-2017]XP_046860285.1 uncharacterized protein LOC124453544 [Xenia sp. Carnegie-2017]